jgi:hypothetical protein
MKSAIDEIVKDKGIKLGLTNLVRGKQRKNILRGNRYTYIPLVSGGSSSGAEVRGVTFHNRALSPEEIKKLYEAGPPVAVPTSLTFSEWLASGIFDAPSTNEAHPKLTVSREILIKRVANVLGASHPEGTDFTDETENRFDPCIRELHQILIVGHPATYHQLLEIAQDILQGMKVLTLESE